jgi:hypothetical protein
LVGDRGMLTSVGGVEKAREYGAQKRWTSRLDGGAGRIALRCLRARV